MSCKAYTVTEISNNNWNDGMIFNCEGRIFIYSDEFNNISQFKNTSSLEKESVKLIGYKDDMFFNGLWYRGGKECRECKNRICGLSSEFFVYDLR